jgi:hypothetical protein
MKPVYLSNSPTHTYHRWLAPLMIFASGISLLVVVLLLP